MDRNYGEDSDEEDDDNAVVDPPRDETDNAVVNPPRDEPINEIDPNDYNRMRTRLMVLEQLNDIRIANDVIPVIDPEDHNRLRNRLRMMEEENDQKSRENGDAEGGCPGSTTQVTD